MQLREEPLPGQRLHRPRVHGDVRPAGDRSMDLGTQRDRCTRMFLASLYPNLVQIQATGNRDLMGSAEADLQIRVQRAASDRRKSLTCRHGHPGTQLMKPQAVDSESQRDRL